MILNPIKVSPRVGGTDSNKQIRYTFDLLNEGEREIILSDNYKDIVLVFGNTGSGKSTFTQWITGNDNELSAKEITAGSGEFIIEDVKNKISKSTVQSKTIFPELFLDAERNQAYYDCPGFSDTRSTSHDISTTFFIKKVLDHVDSAKMILIVGHHTLRRGVDRTDFMELLKHVTDLIKDVNKFHRSIAMVATKVDNQYIRKGREFVLVGDDKVVAGIVHFLLEVRRDLEERSTTSDLSVKEKTFYKGAKELIDILIHRENGKFRRIGIFRRPEEPGPLRNISILQDEKLEIKRIIYENVNFSAVSDGDFGYTISDKSQNDINSLKEEINRNIWTIVSEIAGKLETFYHDLVKDIRSRIKSPSSTTIPDSNKEEAAMFSRKMKTGCEVMSRLLQELTDLKNPTRLYTKFNDTFRGLNIDFRRDILSDLENKARYFNFLQVVSRNELDARPWTDLFKALPTYLSESERIIQDDVSYVSAEIVGLIHLHLNRTSRAILDHYSEKSKLLESEKLPNILSQDYVHLFNMTQKIRRQNTTEELLGTIFNTAEVVNIGLPRKDLVEIAHLGKYFEFLQIISGQRTNVTSFNRFHPFEDVGKHIYESVRWYTFLNDLYLQFSTYEVQKNRRKYNVANLKDFGKDGKKQGIYVNERNFQEFLTKIEQFKIKESTYIRNVKVTESRLKELNHVINLTIKHRIILSCSIPIISIRGAYISVKDIFHNFIEYNDGTCSDYFERGGEYQTLQIFALDSIFVDIDVEGLGLSAIIISPHWEIIGNRKLKLKGINGKSQVKSKPLDSGFFRINRIYGKSKAKNGLYPGSKGDDGRPGGVGGSGPSFFAIGSKFVNGGNLTIINDGGDGGSGEDGGDGYVGRDGSSPDTPLAEDLFCEPDLCDNGKQISGFDCEKIAYSAFQIPIGSVLSGNYATFVTKCEYKITGKSGEPGGDGGHGGKGGKGGSPGRIVLFELAEKSGIAKQFHEGIEGDSGKGGIGGRGGYNGNDIVVYYKIKFFRQAEWYLKETYYNYRSRSGVRGTDGYNVRNMEFPEPLKVLDVSKYLGEYKIYSRENMKERYKISSLVLFYDELERDNNVRNVYDVLDLVNEFQGIEHQFHELNKFMQTVPFYQSLLDRIIDRAERLTVVEKSSPSIKEHKKVLAYLYAAALGKIYNLKENSEFDLIIDIAQYLDLLKEEIKDLKDTRKISNKLRSVNRLKVNYKTSIDKKIEEAKILIENHVTPEIEKIGKQIDEQIDLLVLKTVELEKNAAEETRELKKEKQKLQDALKLRGFFSSLKLIGQVLTCLGPIGAVAGTVIGSTSAITESLVLDDTTNRSGTLQLPESVKSAPYLLRDEIKAYTNKKIADLDNILADILLETAQYPGILNDTTNKLSEIRVRSKEIDKKNPKQVKLLENELRRELEVKVSKLNSQKASLNRKSLKALAVVEKFKKTLQLCEVGIDIYNKYRNDDAKLNAINDAIKQSENNFQKLRQFEESIYNTITPMLQDMEDSLYVVAKKLDAKSRISLDVTKWKVQSSLKDMKLLMKQVVRGFEEVEDNLPRCIEKLEEAMTTLVSVYDHIQNYKEQHNLANFIADVSSPAAIAINITDARLISDVNQLEVLIRSNIILQQYEVALNAFKQFVFPFSHLHLQDFTPPIYSISDENIENLVDQAVAQLEKMKSKMILYESSVKKFDKYIHIGEFSSSYVSSEPFYVWNNSRYGSSISKLLAGKEIVLKADIRRSPYDKDAVKFNSISFNFNSRNDTIQLELNNALKAFQMSATHLGNSYYRYDHQIYMISSSSQTIQYSFEKNSDGVRVDKNIVYDKIQKGNLMLSPYALWRIRLINSTDNISFDNLKGYGDKIDLELAGIGSYLSSEAKDLNLQMDDYFKSDDVYDDLEMIIGTETVIKKGAPSNGRHIRSSNNVEPTHVKDKYATSSSSTLGAYFPINLVCNYFKQGISKLKNTSVEKFKNWFINYDEKQNKNFNGDVSILSNNSVSCRMNHFNAFLETEYENENMSIGCIASENNVGNSINYDLFDVQGTLLLLNLILNKKNDNKYERFINYNNDYAQGLAYRAYKGNNI